MSESFNQPNPGSDEAAKKGCICARIDNHYGKGRGGNGEKRGWFITCGCPLHDEVEYLREQNKWLQSHIYALLCTNCFDDGCQRDGVTSHTCHWCGNDIHEVE